MMLSSQSSTFVNSRLNNTTRHVDNWEGAVLLTTEHMLYKAVMWVFSTVSSKFDVYIGYAGERFSYLKHVKNLWKYERISEKDQSIRPLVFEICEWWNYHLLLIDLSVIILLRSDKHNDFQQYIPNFIQFLNYKWMRHALGTPTIVRCCWPCNISCVIYNSHVGLSHICIQITGLESHVQWCCAAYLLRVSWKD